MSSEKIDKWTQQGILQFEKMRTTRELVSSLSKMIRIAEVFSVKWALIPETVNTLRKLGVVGQECTWDSRISSADNLLIVTPALKQECFWQLATNSYVTLQEVQSKHPEMVIFGDSSIQRGAVVIVKEVL
jgi:hypothetical protein